MVDIFWFRLVERAVVLIGSGVMSSVVWALFGAFVSLWSLIGLKLDKLPVVSCKSVRAVVSCKSVLPVVSWKSVLPFVSCKSVLAVVSCRFVLPVVFCRSVLAVVFCRSVLPVVSCRSVLPVLSVVMPVVLLWLPVLLS